MITVGSGLVDSRIQREVLHYALKVIEQRLGEAVEGLSVAVEGALVALDGGEATSNRGKVDALCTRGKTGVEGLVAPRNGGDELLESRGIPNLLEVVFLGRDVGHVIKLAHLAGSDGLGGIGVHHGHSHVAGVVVHDLEGDTAFVGTCGDGHVEDERGVTELHMAAEVVINGSASGSRGKRTVQDTRSSTDGESSGKGLGTVDRGESD